MPSLPTNEVVTQQKKQMIDSGELSIGEPCTPFTISKVTINSDMDVETKEVTISGRKIPLYELRQYVTSTYSKMSRDDITRLLDSLHMKYDSTSTTEVLKGLLNHLQHHRTLAMWHDHSTILQTGYILFTLSIDYDPAVFFTEEEYRLKTGKKVNIQAIIEEPEIYMLAPSTSSGSDQLALISDRLEDLADLDVPCISINGAYIYDTMRFFCGDKPAQQFEQGTQVGRTYKCGGCGCKDHLIQDQAFAPCKPWRSISTLQKLITMGNLGL